MQKEPEGEEETNDDPETEESVINTEPTTSQNKNKKKKKKKKKKPDLSSIPLEMVIYIPQGRMATIRQPNQHLFCDDFDDCAIIVFEENGAITLMNYDGSDYLKSYQIKHRESVKFFMQKEPVTAPHFLKKAIKVTLKGETEGIRINGDGIYQITNVKPNNLSFHPAANDQLLTLVYRLNTMLDRPSVSKFQRNFFDGGNWTTLTEFDTQLSESTKTITDQVKNGADISNFLQTSNDVKKVLNRYIDEYYNLVQK